MPPEILQKMRDIHYPGDPSWFPPAPGWWLVALLVIAALIWLYRALYRYRRDRAPYQVAKHLLERAQTEFDNGELDARTYLDRCNDILKRLLVRVRNESAASPASGHQWLALLDKLHGGKDFREGAGVALGDERFRRELETDFSQLHRLLNRFVSKLEV